MLNSEPFRTGMHTHNEHTTTTAKLVFDLLVEQRNCTWFGHRMAIVRCAVTKTRNQADIVEVEYVRNT